MPTRTATTRNPVAKKPPGRPRKTAPPPAEPEETPLVVFAPPTPEKAKPAKRVLVFTLDDGKRKFYAPEIPDTGVALRYMKLLRTQEESAYLYLIEKLCGDEAYDALADDPDTTLERIAQVVGALRQLLQGRLEDPKA